jgi:hypothetical protein
MIDGCVFWCAPSPPVLLLILPEIAGADELLPTAPAIAGEEVLFEIAAH